MVSDDQEFGNEFLEKPEGVFRVCNWNIGGWPLNIADPKNQLLKQEILRMEPDVMGLSELNTHWRSVPASVRLSERTMGWFAHQRSPAVAYYADLPNAPRDQVGGVAMWSTDEGCIRFMEEGKDKRGLGRWLWTRYRGASGLVLRVVMGYRPVKNIQGTKSVWSQQKTYFESIGIDTCPTQMFLSDLSEEIQEWMNSGDQVVVAMDANHNEEVGVV